MNQITKMYTSKVISFVMTAKELKKEGLLEYNIITIPSQRDKINVHKVNSVSICPFEGNFLITVLVEES